MCVCTQGNVKLSKGTKRLGKGGHAICLKEEKTTSGTLRLVKKTFRYLSANETTDMSDRRLCRFSIFFLALHYCFYFYSSCPLTFLAFSLSLLHRQ